MENSSQISSNSTKSKKSILSFFSRMFRKSKSSHSSRMTFCEDEEENQFTLMPTINIHGVPMNNQIGEEIVSEGENHSPSLESYIEIVVNDLGLKIESTNPEVKEMIKDEKQSEIELTVENTEEDIQPDANEKIIDEEETHEKKVEVVIETPAGIKDVGEDLDIPEHLHVLPMNIDTRYGGQDFTDEQLPQFCEQLHSLIEIVRNVQATSRSFSKYPRDLQKLLEIDAKELELIYCEIRCVQTTIEQIKKQRELITSGKLEAIEQLTILENEEFEEIEKSINIHDTPIYKSWERTKRSKTPESFEKLIKDIHSNQEALKNLEVLVRNRKAKINYMNKRFRSATGPVSDASNANAVMPSNAVVPSNELQYLALTN